jgi:hypothetical protein
MDHAGIEVEIKSGHVLAQDFDFPASLHGHVPGKLNVLAAKRVTRRNRLVALAGSAAV